jgi:hypothetical protein
MLQSLAGCFPLLHGPHRQTSGLSLPVHSATPTHGPSLTVHIFRLDDKPFAFTIQFFDPKMAPGTTALTLRLLLFPEECFGFLPKISPIFSRLAVNHTKNVWFPADF